MKLTKICLLFDTSKTLPFLQAVIVPNSMALHDSKQGQVGRTGLASHFYTKYGVLSVSLHKLRGYTAASLAG
ncbi:hypothetical protein [Kordiimonas sp.]|uniref:hypothetical protein n=1 Tax=Kordiimonas sp. TaxID=1970157 RepID=UPI003A8F80B1